MGGVQQFEVSQEHEAAINEMKKKSEEQLKAILTTKVSMLNNTLGANMTLDDKKDWSGSVYGEYYPMSILKNRVGGFTHRGIPPDDLSGSKGAVVYFGSNFPGGSNNCAWLLAWYVRGNGTPNKVYVEAGDMRRYAKGVINWDTIKDKLRASSSQSYYKDDATGAEVSANIGPGNAAAVSAVFDVKN